MQSEERGEKDYFGMSPAKKIDKRRKETPLEKKMTCFSSRGAYTIRVLSEIERGGLWGERVLTF